MCTDLIMFPPIIDRCVNKEKTNLRMRSLKITNINALSCFAKLTSLLELTLNLDDCKGLIDLDPLSSIDRCVNPEKLNLRLRSLKVSDISPLSIQKTLTKTQELIISGGSTETLGKDIQAKHQRALNQQEPRVARGMPLQEFARRGHGLDCLELLLQTGLRGIALVRQPFISQQSVHAALRSNQTLERQSKRWLSRLP